MKIDKQKGKKQKHGTKNTQRGDQITQMNKNQNKRRGAKFTG